MRELTTLSSHLSCEIITPTCTNKCCPQASRFKMHNLCMQVAGASLHASAQVCQRLLGSLIRAAQPAEQPDQASADGSSLALTAILAIVRATRECSLEQPLGQAEGVPILAGKAPEVLQAALTEGSSSSIVGEPAHAEGSMEAPPEVQLALVAQLATFPAAHSPLGEPDQERALRFLLHSVTQPALGATEGDSGAQAASRVATEALAEMARQGHAQLLRSHALPVLLEAAAAGDGGGGKGNSWQGAGALAALHALAPCSKDLCRDVREALFGLFRRTLQQQGTGAPRGQYEYSAGRAHSVTHVDL